MYSNPSVSERYPFSLLVNTRITSSEKYHLFVVLVLCIFGLIFVRYATAVRSSGPSLPCP